MTKCTENKLIVKKPKKIDFFGNLRSELGDNILLAFLCPTGKLVIR